MHHLFFKAVLKRQLGGGLRSRCKLGGEPADFLGDSLFTLTVSAGSFIVRPSIVDFFEGLFRDRRRSKKKKKVHAVTIIDK